MSEESLYEVLGVSDSASAEEITEAHRRLIRLTHPDVGGNSFLFRRVHDAHAVLSDPAKRASYDRDRSRPPQDAEHFDASPESGWTRVDDPPGGWSASATNDDEPVDDDWSNGWSDAPPPATPNGARAGRLRFLSSRPWIVVLVASFLLLQPAPAVGLLLLLLGAVAGIGSRRAARRQALRYASAGNIDAMDGTRFEHYVGEVMRASGYRVKHIGKVGDFGADLLLEREGRTSVVQTKRYSNSVGVAAVREAAAARGFYHADHAIVITNSFFTGPAYQLARSNQVDLWDRHALADLARRAHGQSSSPVALLGAELLAGASMVLTIFGALAFSGTKRRWRRSRWW